MKHLKIPSLNFNSIVFSGLRVRVRASKNVGAVVS
jgi:hypothetical protein